MPGKLATSRPSILTTALGYTVLVALAIGGFWLIRHFGEQLAPPAGAVTNGVSSPGSAAKSELVLFHVLLALLVILVGGRAVGYGLKWFGQPPVIGEVLAGIMLGPSLLGWLAPEVSAYILPRNVAPYLGVIAQLAVILYMFIVGLELDLGRLRGQGQTAVAISHASIVAPFILGAALALGLYTSLSPPGISFTVFALFSGVAMSVTAFPVLARILTDRGLSRTPLGIMALTCAAVDDVTAWCLLALVVGVAQATVGGALIVIAMTIGYLALMLVVVRPIVGRVSTRFDTRELTTTGMAVVMGAVLLSALATELIGIHAIFGAFLLGAIVPHDSVIAREVPRRLQDLVAVLLLPAFFALTGMRTEIGLISGLGPWLLCGLIIAVATLGKFGGTLAAARLTGLGWRDASALGILMNTRGLMELIVLNIGLDLGVISPTLFAMLVIMAVVTTLATTPILQMVWQRENREQEA